MTDNSNIIETSDGFFNEINILHENHGKIICNSNIRPDFEERGLEKLRLNEERSNIYTEIRDLYIKREELQENKPIRGRGKKTREYMEQYMDAYFQYEKDLDKLNYRIWELNNRLKQIDNRLKLLN